MRSHRIEFLVYLVGVLPLGLFQHKLRVAIGHDGVSFAAVVAYLFALRIVGRFFSKRISQEPSSEG
jgi:hypothetical protein